MSKIYTAQRLYIYKYKYYCINESQSSKSIWTQNVNKQQQQQKCVRRDSNVFWHKCAKATHNLYVDNMNLNYTLTGNDEIVQNTLLWRNLSISNPTTLKILISVVSNFPSKKLKSINNLVISTLCILLVL